MAANPALASGDAIPHGRPRSELNLRQALITASSNYIIIVE